VIPITPPHTLAFAALDALRKTDFADAEAVRLGEMVAEGGPDRVLGEVCGIQPDDEAFRSCRDEWRAIRPEGE
jgi:hypothetical protein